MVFQSSLKHCSPTNEMLWKIMCVSFRAKHQLKPILMLSIKLGELAGGGTHCCLGLHFSRTGCSARSCSSTNCALGLCSSGISCMRQVFVTHCLGGGWAPVFQVGKQLHCVYPFYCYYCCCFSFPLLFC